MSVQIRRRGDTIAAHANFIGADREITIDTDKWTVVVHNGEIRGGFPLAREDLANVDKESITSKDIAQTDARNFNDDGIGRIKRFIEDDFVGVVFSAPVNELSGFLICDGAAVSREHYAKLFERIGTTFGAGDGTETFNIPDYRGFFIRGKGGNSATDFKITQSDAIRNITGYLTSDQNGVSGAFYVGTKLSNYADGSGGVGYNLHLDASRVVPTAVENRPINKAVNFFIKY